MENKPFLSIQRHPSDDNLTVKERRMMSHLPLIRYSTLSTLFIAIDSLLSISLWLAGGNTSYLEKSVEHFSLYKSTFDLACIAAIRCVILIICLYYLEHYSLVGVSTKYEDKQFVSQRLAKVCQTVFLLVSIVSLIYAIIKGVLLLVHGTDVLNELHVTYKVLCVVGVVNPALEIVLGLSSFYFMWRLLHVHKLRLVLNESETTKPRKKADLKRIAKLAIPEYPILSIGIIMLIISNAVQAVTPYFFGRVIDLAIRNETLCQEITNGVVNATGDVPHCSLWPMNRTILILVGLFGVASVAGTFRNYLFTVAGERFVARLRKNLFSAIMRQEMGFFDKNRTGELTNRLASDTAVIQSAVTENISIMVRYTLQLIISLGIMFWINAKLTAVLLSVIPIIIIGAVHYGRYLKEFKKKYQDKLALASSTAEESISNIRTVRGFCNEPKMTSSYDKDIESSYDMGKLIALFGAVFMGVVSSLVYGACSLILWYGGYLVYHGHLSSGELTALMLYTLTLAMCFAFISNIYGEFMQAVGASIRIFELLDRQSEVEDGRVRCRVFKGEIEFKDVHFTYPSRPDEPVLKGVSLNVQPGEMVALVGPSGGGKSTIVNLIEHFYEISAGEVLVGGMNVRDLDPMWFRCHIGIVNQEPVLFAASIRDNISFGKDNATQYEIEEVSRQANAHDFIMSFEDQYDTMVGERGIRLSGGQKQRVAIARALLLNPDILLLDEATSALDAESEHLVQEAIDRAMEGRTVLVIAHRLSTVRNATKVIVLDKGCIVEEGTHDELLALNGVYKKLVLHQLMSKGESSFNNSPKLE